MMMMTIITKLVEIDTDERQKAWAVGDCCVSLKMLKSPHKEIYSSKLMMLCLSLSSSSSLSPCCIDSALCLEMRFWKVPKGKNKNGLGIM